MKMTKIKEEKSTKEFCRNCVNFLELNSEYNECDYDYFLKTSNDKAQLFMPVLFDCNKFEDMEDI